MTDNTEKTTPADVNTAVPNGIAAEAKTLFTQAQDAIEDAVDATVEAVKEHPIAAAAIAAGATAAVAGAAYGLSQLLGGEHETPAKKARD